MKRLLLVLLLVLPLSASAQTASDPARQIIILTNQLNALRAKAFPAPENFSFERDLFVGIENNGDVRRLQEVLALLGLFSDALVRGNFGPLTRAAVVSYQTERGIPRTGYVGPRTRGALNAEAALTYRIRPRPAYDLSAIAKSIQDGINVERRGRGFEGLVWEVSVAEVAWRHSENQAMDNVELTNSGLLCAYPLIRHENFSGAFKAGDRLRAAEVDYRLAGENIISFSVAENILYRSADQQTIVCPSASEFAPGMGTVEARRKLFNTVFAERLTAAQVSPVAVWINKEWMSPERIAAKSVSGWMDSPGHRDNILTPEFTRGGVGIAVVNEFLVITHLLVQ
ncbi:MAG: peptidoglycan-binding protein [bacterium]|nr:peptidoglycan-binding protein [bacterium]